MAIQTKPIPALYIVYILRSTVRHASVYIGSTPHPPRRLNQHNGVAKGGASRTARDSLRPWEMVGVVSGFPSMVGALKFEWALNNPHMSLHIAPEDRISISTGRKRNGQPRRPPHSITSVLPNLHLLLHVPSFARWPLSVHFFDREVYQRWGKYCAGSGVRPLRSSLAVLTDFGPATPAEAAELRREIEELTARAIAERLRMGFIEEEEEKEKEKEVEGDVEGLGSGEEEAGGAAQGWGVHALPLDYAPLGSYVEKAQNITSFEREGQCVVCHEHLEHGKGLYAICSNSGCEGVGHLDCWSRHLLRQKGEADDDGILLPMEGRCPECDGAVKWGDMMKELTLRTRGEKEVGQLLRRRKKAIAAAAKTSKAAKKSAATEKAEAALLSRAALLAKLSSDSKDSARSRAPAKERAGARR